MLKAAPIVLFTYNRPLHTQKVLDLLSINEGAEHSTLYIYQDGLPQRATDEQRKQHKSVSEVVKKFLWPGKKNVLIKEQNCGLAESIIGGVTELTEKYGRVIVLEDDILPSFQFLNYMNSALEYYAENDQVGHISAYMFPINTSGLPDTFFYGAATCWGWATWEKSWKYFERDATKLIRDLKDKELVKHFNLDGSYDFFQMLQDNRDGKNNSWAIRWQASLRLNNLLSLHPKKSYTQNIGFDGTGVHCNITNNFDHSELNEKLFIPQDIPLEESKLVRKRMRNFYFEGNSRLKRIKALTKEILLRK